MTGPYLLMLCWALGFACGFLAALLLAGQRLRRLIVESQARSADLESLREQVQRALIESPWGSR